MKKICYITTKVTTLDSFVFPLLDTILEKTDWKISVICDDEAAAYGMVPKGIDYFPVSMERGISLTGIKAMLQMYRIHFILVANFLVWQMVRFSIRIPC